MEPGLEPRPPEKNGVQNHNHGARRHDEGPHWGARTTPQREKAPAAAGMATAL
jgi:hypothetical protein